MIRTEAISRETFNHAYDEFLQVGQKPTVRLIRGRTGGSHTTILKFLQEREPSFGTPIPPPGLPVDVIKVLQTSYSRNAADATSEWQARLQVTQTNVTDLATENEALQIQVEDLSLRCESQTGDAALLRGQLIEKTAENKELRWLLAQAQATIECTRVKAAEAITSSEINAAANLAYKQRETVLFDQLGVTRESLATACAEKLDAQQRAAACTQNVQDERQKCSMLEAKICQLEIELRCVKDAATQRGAADTTTAEIRADITALRELLARLTTSATLPSTLEGADQVLVEGSLNEETAGPDAIATKSPMYRLLPIPSCRVQQA